MQAAAPSTARASVPASALPPMAFDGPDRVLLLPGWLDSEGEHWQSRWEARHGFERVVQHDWLRPRRGDWVAQLGAVLADHAAQQPGRRVFLVAHSLGCHLVAAWARRATAAGEDIAAAESAEAPWRWVQGALLVAPPDLMAPSLPEALWQWRQNALRDAEADADAGQRAPTLPFSALVMYSEDDPFGRPAAARALAAQWGASALSMGPRGHLNADSGLGDWPDGLQALRALGWAAQRAGG